MTKAKQKCNHQWMKVKWRDEDVSGCYFFCSKCFMEKGLHPTNIEEIKEVKEDKTKW